MLLPNLNRPRRKDTCPPPQTQFVKPPCVRSSREKHNNKFCVAVMRFLHPLADLPPIRWIAPDTPCPFLCKPVLLLCKILFALGVFFCCASVQSKMIDGIEFVKKPLWRRPYIRFAAEYSCCVYPASPSSTGFNGQLPPTYFCGYWHTSPFNPHV